MAASGSMLSESCERWPKDRTVFGSIRFEWIFHEARSESGGQLEGEVMSFCQDSAGCLNDRSGYNLDTVHLASLGENLVELCQAFCRSDSTKGWQSCLKSFQFIDIAQGF